MTPPLGRVTVLPFVCAAAVFVGSCTETPHQRPPDDTESGVRPGERFAITFPHDRDRVKQYNTVEGTMPIGLLANDHRLFIAVWPHAQTYEGKKVWWVQKYPTIRRAAPNCHFEGDFNAGEHGRPLVNREEYTVVAFAAPENYTWEGRKIIGELPAEVTPCMKPVTVYRDP